jgi:transglutaminase superfamily protein
MLENGSGGSRVPLTQLWLAARVGAWLCSLPIVLRDHSLSSLLESLPRAAKLLKTGRTLEPVRTAEIVARVCGLPCFRLPIFPRACLRRALALYYVLAKDGFPIEIHIGVRKDGRDLHAHSWVALDGKALRERNPEKDFRTIYSYRADSNRSNSAKMREPQPAWD